MSANLLDAIQANLLSPALLFFVLGIVATLLKSDLKFPEPLYITLTIYLLTAIGFKGGAALSEAGFAQVWLPVLAGIALGVMIPLWTYAALRHLGRFSRIDAAAICAHYGSVSAVTFIAATNFLKQVNTPYPEYATAFLAVMESPAIVVGVILGKLALAPAAQAGAGGAAGASGAGANSPASDVPTSLSSVLRGALHEALCGRSVVLLVGALIVGILAGKRGLDTTAGFFVTPFQGVLALFLLEMGMVAARRLADLRKAGPFLLAFGIVAPLINGVIGVFIGKWEGLGVGGSMLFGTLAASASYIAAPAAIRLALPEANPTYYLTAALGITFPFNIALGLPIYLATARWAFGADAS